MLYEYVPWINPQVHEPDPGNPTITLSFSVDWILGYIPLSKFSTSLGFKYIMRHFRLTYPLSQSSFPLTLSCPLSIPWITSQWVLTWVNFLHLTVNCLLSVLSAISHRVTTWGSPRLYHTEPPLEYLFRRISASYPLRKSSDGARWAVPWVTSFVSH